MDAAGGLPVPAAHPAPGAPEHAGGERLLRPGEGALGLHSPAGTGRRGASGARAGGDREGAPTAAATGAHKRQGACAAGARWEGRLPPAPRTASPSRHRGGAGPLSLSRAGRVKGARGDRSLRFPPWLSRREPGAVWARPLSREPRAGKAPAADRRPPRLVPRQPPRPRHTPATWKETGESPGSPELSPFLSGFPQKSGNAGPKPSSSEGRTWAACLRVNRVAASGRCSALRERRRAAMGLEGCEGRPPLLERTPRLRFLCNRFLPSGSYEIDLVRS